MTIERRLHQAAQSERREAPWADVEVVSLVTRERHQAAERYKVLVHDSILAQGYTQLLHELLARPDLALTATQQRDFKVAMDQLRVYQRYVRDHLRPEPPIEPSLRSIIPSEAESQLVQLTEPEDSLAHEANVRSTSDALASTSRPEVFGFSDSHTATSYLLQALHEAGVTMHRVGVLTFDHHTDLRPISGGAKKDSVFTHVVQELGVGAVAIAGFDRRFAAPESSGKRRQRIERLPSDLYYTHGQPDTAKFLRDIAQMFAEWKAQGITSLYTSVDLDALRLPEQLYTATDYNPIDSVRWLLDVSEREILMERFRRGATNLTLSRAQDTAGWLHSVLQHNQLTQYQGVPASWVTRAQRLAHEQFGLQLGITRPGTEQRVVGDVVEFTPPDYQGRTARIAKAILGGMAKASQA